MRALSRRTGPRSRGGLPFDRDAPVPRHDIRLPNERARLGAHQGHARVARARRGGVPDEADVDRVQHVHDPREARHAAGRVPRKRGRAEASSTGRRRRCRRLLRRGAARADLRALPVRRCRLRPRVDPAPRRVDRSRWVRGRARPIRHARAFRGRSPDPWRTALPGMGSGVHGVQLRVRVLHRPGRSRPRAEPAARARSSPRSLGSPTSGVREITLLGQNVNSWGRDLAPELSTEFGELLRACDDVPGIERIRFTSPHPKDFRDPVVEAMAECASVCEHVHLPAQSGSSRILKSMRRTYDRDRYLRPRRPTASGGPRPCAGNRSHRRFSRARPTTTSQQTLSLVEEVRFDSAFTFIFSPACGDGGGHASRSGTGRGEARATRAARRGRPANRVGAERRACRPDRGSPRRGSEPDRFRSATRAHEAKHDGQLRRHCRGRFDRRRASSRMRHRRRCAGARRRSSRPERRRRMRTLGTLRDTRVRFSSLCSQWVVGRGAPREVTTLGVEVIAIFGPTASGKSAVAQALAEPHRHGGRLGRRAPGLSRPADPHEPAGGADPARRYPRPLGDHVRRRVRALAHEAIDELVASNGMRRRRGRHRAVPACGARRPARSRPPLEPGVPRARSSASTTDDPAAAHERLGELDPAAAESST